jgi:hypothetical protein
MSKELEAKMVPATIEGIKEVTQILDSLGIKRNAKTGELIGDVPGFGVAAGIVPSFALSDKGKDLRGAAANVANKLLQAQSGLAVTDQENKRFLRQLEQGTFMSDRDFLSGWNRVVTEVEGRLANVKGGYHPDVINEYTKRNPKLIFDLPRPNFGGGKKEAPKAEANPAGAFFK